MRQRRNGNVSPIWPRMMFNPVCVSNKPAMDWVNDLQISRDDKVKLLSGNAKRLLRM